ncbi:hypothetical protein PRZ48_007864 [Zasmidium cellare]|uniref:Uncharacterized protein n=1 Tax=Zasmidium cellare TaxID=395010 RepID=A0ABR0ELG1_ZASCE|nr:hypothetical protein PRZ48_007864 [Zasmidium cellare]
MAKVKASSSHTHRAQGAPMDDQPSNTASGSNHASMATPQVSEDDRSHPQPARKKVTSKKSRASRNTAQKNAGKAQKAKNSALAIASKKRKADAARQDLFSSPGSDRTASASAEDERAAQHLERLADIPAHVNDGDRRSTSICGGDASVEDSRLDGEATEPTSNPSTQDRKDATSLLQSQVAAPDFPAEDGLHQNPSPTAVPHDEPGRSVAPSRPGYQTRRLAPFTSITGVYCRYPSAGYGNAKPHHIPSKAQRKACTPAAPTSSLSIGPVDSTRSGIADDKHATPRFENATGASFDLSSHNGPKTFVFKSTMPGTYPASSPTKRLKTASAGQLTEGEFDYQAKNEHLQHLAEDWFLLGLRYKLFNARDSIYATAAAAWVDPIGISQQFIRQCIALVAGRVEKPELKPEAGAEAVTEAKRAILQPNNKRSLNGAVKSGQEPQAPKSDLVKPDLAHPGLSGPEEILSKMPGLPKPKTSTSSKSAISTDARATSTPDGNGHGLSIDSTPVQAFTSEEPSTALRLPQADPALSLGSGANASNGTSPILDHFTRKPIDYEMLPLPEITYATPRVFDDEITYPMFMSLLSKSRISAINKRAIYLSVFRGARSIVYIDEAKLLEAINMMNDETLAFFEPQVCRDIANWVQTEGLRYFTFMSIVLETSLTQEEAHYLYHVFFSGQPFILNLNDETIDRARQIACDSLLRDRFAGIVHLFLEHLPLRHYAQMMEYDYTTVSDPVDTDMSGMEVTYAPATNAGPSQNANIALNISPTSASAQQNATPATTSGLQRSTSSQSNTRPQSTATPQPNTARAGNGTESRSARRSAEEASA